MSAPVKRNSDSMQSPELPENKRTEFSSVLTPPKMAAIDTDKHKQALKKFLENKKIDSGLKQLAQLIIPLLDACLLDAKVSDVGEIIGTKLVEYHKIVDDRNLKQQTQIKSLTKKVARLEDDMESQETYYRRSNLVFSGVPESTDENVFKWFNKMAKEQLKIEKHLQIERIHRMGPEPDPAYPNRRPRDIIVRFSFYQDRYIVFDARRNFKGTGIFVNDHHTPRVVEKRRRLLPIAKEARVQGFERATVISDKLIINGDKFTIDTLDDLPDSLEDIAKSERVSSGGTKRSFFRKYSMLSNHYPAPFIIDGEEFNCNEDWFLYNKCLSFRQHVAAAKIHDTDDPALMVKYSKVCRGNSPSWTPEMACDIMKRGCYAKFSQNEDCKEYLLSTDQQTLIEGSKWDKVWGAGIDFNDDKVFDDMLPGQNKLGSVLMDVRAQLRTET